MYISKEKEYMSTIYIYQEKKIYNSPPNIDLYVYIYVTIKIENKNQNVNVR